MATKRSLPWALVVSGLLVLASTAVQGVQPSTLPSSSTFSTLSTGPPPPSGLNLSISYRQTAVNCNSLAFTMSFFGNASGGTPPYHFSWNFGDGSPGVSGQNATHAYNESGPYSVTLAASDQLGDSGSTEVSVFPAYPPCATMASIPWWDFAVLITVLVGVGVGFWLVVARRRRSHR